LADGETVCGAARSAVERERLNSWQIALRGSRSPSRLITMDAGTRIRDIKGERERRRAARELIGDYHEAELRKLLDHVRQGFRRLDAGEIDPFELDDLIHRYKRSAQKLWSFCGSSGSGWEHAALTIESLREHGEDDPDWWAASEPRVRDHDPQ
jgi:hypothetical protein